MRMGNLDLPSPVFLAPMAGITDAPFRKIVQRFGVSAVWTEMISAAGLVVGGKHFSTMQLDGHHVPTVFQICGSDPTIMGRAAEMVQDLGASAVDLNMGCPVKKVVRRGAGAALMKNLPLAERIVAAVRRAVDIPVSVKIRSGWDEQNTNAPEIAKVVEQEGADCIVVHCRSRSRVHSGPANLGVLTQVKAKVKIPVIGNGGINNAEEATRMKAVTGCDGVMIGRAVLGRPWLPGRILGSSDALSAGGQEVTFLEVIRDHFSYQLEVRDVYSAVRRMRKHLAWYSRGFQGSGNFRRSVIRMEEPSEIIKSIERFFGKAVIS